MAIRDGRHIFVGTAARLCFLHVVASHGRILSFSLLTGEARMMSQAATTRKTPFLSACEKKNTKGAIFSFFRVALEIHDAKILSLLISETFNVSSDEMTIGPGDRATKDR